MPSLPFYDVSPRSTKNAKQDFLKTHILEIYIYIYRKIIETNIFLEYLRRGNKKVFWNSSGRADTELNFSHYFATEEINLHCFTRITTNPKTNACLCFCEISACRLYCWHSCDIAGKFDEWKYLKIWRVVMEAAKYDGFIPSLTGEIITRRLNGSPWRIPRVTGKIIMKR